VRPIRGHRQGVEPVSYKREWITYRTRGVPGVVQPDGQTEIIHTPIDMAHRSRLTGRSLEKEPVTDLRREVPFTNLAEYGILDLSLVKDDKEVRIVAKDLSPTQARRHHGRV